MKHLKFFLVVLFSIPNFVAMAAGDPFAGKSKAEPCAACHNVDGNSVMPDWPKLAEQGEKYIVKQLKAFKSGSRKNDLMAPMAASLSDQDMEDIAAYFSIQKVTIGKADPDLVEAGEKLYRGGDAERGIPACMACHSPTGSGNPAAAYPSLKGQHAAYTIKQLQAFRTGVRKTDDKNVMRDIAERLRDSDIEAVASYINGLH